ATYPTTTGIRQLAQVLTEPVERALGAPVEDGIVVQKHSHGGQEVVIAAHLAGRYLDPAEIVPFALRLRQDQAHLLDSRVAVDDHQDLRPIDRVPARGDRRLGS